MKLTPAQMKTLAEARQILEEQATYGDVFNSPTCVRDYMAVRIAHLEHEVFLVMYLDTQHRLIEARQEFRGTIDAASVYPREIAKSALELNAAAVVFGHNHPSGMTEASQADKRLTLRLRDALGLFDIKVLDHVIVGAGPSYSFAEKGLL